MRELYVFVPTRARPDNAERLQAVFKKTEHAHVRFVVDADDPRIDDYLRQVGTDDLIISPRGRPGIVDPLNFAVAELLPSIKGNPHLGFMGDDHYPHGDMWADDIIDVLDRMGTGLCYGNDLLMGERIPTAVFLTKDIVDVLGYMAPPELHHLFVDNYWLELGRGTDSIEYMPEVIIEHLHFLNGKAEMDQTYAECNDPNAIRDRDTFNELKENGRLQDDIEKVKAVMCKG